MNPTCLLSALTSVVLIMTSTVPAKASVIVTNITAPPATDVILQHIPSAPETGSIAFSWTNQYEIGQSFYVKQNISISAITLPFTTFQPGALNKEFTLTIYEAGSDTESPGTALSIASDTGYLPTSLSANTFLRFELASPVDLQPDKYYIVMLRSNETGTSVNFTIANTDPQAAHSYTWHNTASGGTYARYTNRGLTIYVEGAAVVPETSTLGLIVPILGAGILLRKRFLTKNRNTPLV
ncbi:MAG TPA: hypothetical protein VNQ90_05720 [Chthoniobacteraceae bacterium]|nr:hypothetical protein [Chthoniobacteraceae bacterium]